MGLITHKSCPVCGGEHLTSQLRVKDYTVSKKEFTIIACAQCTLRFTQDIPDDTSIVDYYRSDNYISHTDTKEGLVNRLYHLIRKKTIANKLKFIQQSTGIDKGELLDLGAGTGAFLHYVQLAGWKVTGLEPDITARNKAKELYGLTLQDSPELFKLPAEKFDVITLWHVLEHVHDLHPYIEQLQHLLKPGGAIFIAVPNYTSFDAEHYKEYWAAYDVPRHLYHFSPLSMQVLVEQHKLKLEQIQPMWYDSFYISMLSEQYKTGHANNIKAAWVGLQSNWSAVWDKEKCSSLIYVIEKTDSSQLSAEPSSRPGSR